MIDQNFVLTAWWAVTAGVLAAIGGAGGVVALIKSGADRRKIIAEAAKTDVEKVALLSTIQGQTRCRFRSVCSGMRRAES